MRRKRTVQSTANRGAQQRKNKRAQHNHALSESKSLKSETKWARHTRKRDLGLEDGNHWGVWAVGLLKAMGGPQHSTIPLPVGIRATAEDANDCIPIPAAQHWIIIQTTNDVDTGMSGLSCQLDCRVCRGFAHRSGGDTRGSERIPPSKGDQDTKFCSGQPLRGFCSAHHEGTRTQCPIPSPHVHECTPRRRKIAPPPPKQNAEYRQEIARPPMGIRNGCPK